jgi:outer membrane protein OmpA-like peptidoglycan-associated protein
MVAGYASFASAQYDDDDGQPWINNVPPMSYWGLRGLTQTVSAEPLGMGRLNFAILGSYFKQDQDLSGLKGYRYNPLDMSKPYDSIPGGPSKGSSVSMMRLGASWGINDHFDIFGSLPFYILSDSALAGGTLFHLGEMMGGVQFALPIPEEIPLRIAAQVRLIYGMTEDDYGVTNNPAYLNGKEPEYTYAGYEYGEARKKDLLDLVISSSQSLVAGNLRRAVKLHLNEGFAITPGKAQADDWLVLLAAGVEIDPTEFLTIGAEINYRTPITSFSATDPLWLTPSLMLRSPYYSEGLFGIAFVAGADFSLSKAKDTAVIWGREPTKAANGAWAWKSDTAMTKSFKPLESWRVFGNLVFSFDLLASQRAAMIREARANAAEKARLKREAELTSAQKDSIARKAHEDSLRLSSEMASRAHSDSLRAKAMADSLSEKARQDSMAQAQAAANAAALQADAAAQREAALRADAEKKRIADSIALADVNKRLAEEKAKRSEAEQMLLSTGMMVLDAVYFQSGKTEIHLNSRPYLTTIAKMLAKYPKLKIEIGGHTDNVGKLETNMALSQNRAQAVVLFMTNTEPALGQMLTARGYGPSVPKADNNTAAGREVNRRVELKVLNPNVLKEYNP